MKKINGFLILGISVALLLSACMNPDTNNPVKEPDLVSVEDQDTVSVEAGDEDIIQRSETISDAVVELYGIDDATTIILNDEALIGVKIAYDEKLTPEIKDLIQDTVKSKDGAITNILLTDNDKIFWDINHIVTDILQGQSYENSLSKIHNLKFRIR